MENKVCEETIDWEIQPEVIERRNQLFKKYVEPYFNMIYKLCINYSFCSENVEENYNGVLINFYRRIETYDPEKSLLTWLHIVTKRQVQELERQRRRHDNRDRNQDVEFYKDAFLDHTNQVNCFDVNKYREYYSDDILNALDKMKPIYRRALLYQEAGFSLKEIVEMEYKNGTLKTKNLETIKSRLFHARQFMRNQILKNDRRKTY